MDNQQNLSVMTGLQKHTSYEGACLTILMSYLEREPPQVWESVHSQLLYGPVDLNCTKNKVK